MPAGRARGLLDDALVYSIGAGGFSLDAGFQIGKVACVLGGGDQPELAFRCLGFVEIRGMWGKNIMALDAKEIAEARLLLEKYKLRVSSIASPIFKVDWPGAPVSKQSQRDQFGANFTLAQQDELLERGFELARVFRVDHRARVPDQDEVAIGGALQPAAAAALQPQLRRSGTGVVRRRPARHLHAPARALGGAGGGHGDAGRHAQRPPGRESRSVPWPCRRTCSAASQPD